MRKTYALRQRSVSENIWTGWKFVCLGVSFTRNHLNRKKIQTFSRSKFRVNGQKILNSLVWTKCPVKYSAGRKFVWCRGGTKRGQNLCTRCQTRESIRVQYQRGKIYVPSAERGKIYALPAERKKIYPPCTKRGKIYAMSAEYWEIYAMSAERVPNGNMHPVPNARKHSHSI